MGRKKENKYRYAVFCENLRGEYVLRSKHSTLKLARTRKARYEKYGKRCIIKEVGKGGEFPFRISSFFSEFNDFAIW